MVERLKQQGTSHSSRDLLKIDVYMGVGDFVTIIINCCNLKDTNKTMYKQKWM